MHRHCQRPQGAVAPQVAPKDKGMRLGAMLAGLRSKMRWPRRRPQGAVAPQVASKDKGARLVGGARRVGGNSAGLQPLAAEESVGVGLKPRRPDNAFVLHHAQMRKRIEEAQVTLGNRNLACRTFRQVRARRRI